MLLPSISHESHPVCMRVPLMIVMITGIALMLRNLRVAFSLFFFLPLEWQTVGSHYAPNMPHTN